MSKKTYIRLNTEISNLKGKSLEKRIKSFLKKNNKIICKGINKRPVFIDEYIESTLNRNDGHNRMRSFFSSMELIKNSVDTTDKQKIGNNLFSYEFKGMTPKGSLVGVHIKEKDDGKNKVLKLISNFWDNKKI